MLVLTRTLESPVGELTLAASANGLRAVLWPQEREGRVDLGYTETADDAPVLNAAAEQITEYFAGDRMVFEIPLDPVGTAFQVKAWYALGEIRYGETATYSQQAERIGSPKAVRAVGAANGRNPLSIILPCHRVVGADGSLTGFAGGLEWKRWLLDHERRIAGTETDPTLPFA